jgi:hypothetical protein
MSWIGSPLTAFVTGTSVQTKVGGHVFEGAGRYLASADRFGFGAKRVGVFEFS